MKEQISATPPLPKPIIRNCTFKYKCNRSWDSLKAFDNEPRVRHCEDCNKRVYLVTTNKLLALALKMDHCIAIPNELVDFGEVINTTIRDKQKPKHQPQQKHLVGYLRLSSPKVID